MSLVDVVVDTNVFMHAQNPKEKRFGESVTFVKRLRETPCKLAVDPGFDVTDANRSKIGQEYLQHLRAGSVAFEIVAFLFANKRVSEVTDHVGGAINRKIVRLITDSTDRIFVKVAINSESHALVCHDFHGGFQAARRPKLGTELKIIVIDAVSCCAIL